MMNVAVCNYLLKANTCDKIIKWHIEIFPKYINLFLTLIVNIEISKHFKRHYHYYQTCHNENTISQFDLWLIFCQLRNHVAPLPCRCNIYIWYICIYVYIIDIFLEILDISHWCHTNQNIMKLTLSSFNRINDSLSQWSDGRFIWKMIQQQAKYQW